MTKEPDLNQMREELNKIQEQMKRSRRRAAVGFVILLLALIASFLYAFTQQVAATRNAEEANRQHQERRAAEERAVFAEARAITATKLANEQQAAAEQAFRQAQEALEKCRKGKK